MSVKIYDSGGDMRNLGNEKLEYWTLKNKMKAIITNRILIFSYGYILYEEWGDGTEPERIIKFPSFWCNRKSLLEEFDLDIIQARIGVKHVRE